MHIITIRHAYLVFSLVFASTFSLLPYASAQMLSKTTCDIGYLEVEGSAPRLNKEWVPQIGVNFIDSNGAKSRSIGFVPSTKTKFTMYIKKPGSSKFKKAKKMTKRYGAEDILYRGVYMSIKKKYFKTKGTYSIKVLVEGNKLPAGRISCPAIFSVNVQ